MTGFIYKKLTLTMLLLAFMQGAASQVSRLVLDGVVYESNGGKWEVSGIDTSDSNFPSNGVITIRDAITVQVFGDEEPTELAVKTIQRKAFQNEDILRGINISDGIEEIGADAFDGCKNITSLVLPRNLKVLGEGALRCSDNLRWIDFRKVEAPWSDLLVDGNVFQTPDDMGVPDFTLMYMPSWWTWSTDMFGKRLTNVVYPDNGDLKCIDFYYSSNFDYCVPWAFTAAKVRTNRSLAQDLDGAYSVCLPYSMPVPANARVYSMSVNNLPEGDIVMFRKINGDIEANTPYLVMADDNVSLDFQSANGTSIPTTENAAAQSTTIDGVTINGTFARISNSVAISQDIYVLQANNEWKPITAQNTQVTVPPFRAYLTLDDSSQASFSIGFTDEPDPAHIESVTATHHYNGSWYSIDGRRLPSSPTLPGVYIINGRKMVIHESQQGVTRP